MEDKIKISIEQYGDRLSIETGKITADDVVEKILDALIAVGYTQNMIPQAARHYAYMRIGDKCVCPEWGVRTDKEKESGECFECGYKI